eukprot:TRINITY_DN16728_c0_g1_i1.p3 TRINITY_DN16728_c0_g1~~TRINITY_DN16728_c0_g1_i1.p3  ORF type:complete len:130 (+),score=16.45 TRINITY_DN16728_c0_g1_i1:96-485(+)
MYPSTSAGHSQVRRAFTSRPNNAQPGYRGARPHGGSEAKLATLDLQRQRPQSVVQTGAAAAAAAAVAARTREGQSTFSRERLRNLGDAILFAIDASRRSGWPAEMYDEMPEWLIPRDSEPAAFFWRFSV